ncbi:hypothetical protein NP493_365g00033 [Ridgeia piscesae]|uniref:H15 domain-containing protein n=1 Tax=Ridgeia piscesae TaxID=27915 RepID=A0AAD9L322_RIDPI|nr:hypothetical protein NP493_365g00033 [Ridgeia piscesae]
MSAVAATPAPARPAKKAAAKPKKPAAHPKYTEMIAAALGSLKDRGGSSRQAVLKYIVAHYNVGKDERVVNQHLKMALRAGAKNGTLKQAKGTGAAGSFRIGEKKAAAKKPKAASRPKKAIKKAAKSPKKVKKPKSPAKAKKAKKPVVAKAKKPKAAPKPKKPVAVKAKKAKTPVKAKKAAKPKKAAPKKA